LEGPLLRDIRADGLPEPETEFWFCKTLGRRYRWDFAWPDHFLALEIEGGSWTGGRHVRGKSFEEDCLKYTLGAFLGWRVLRVNNHMVDDGRAVLMVAYALGEADASTLQLLASYKCQKCLTAEQKRKLKGKK